MPSPCSFDNESRSIKLYFEWFLLQITRRYAEFSTTLLSVNEKMPNPRLYPLLNQLQVEVQNFILRLASEFSQRKEQLISLINNYDLMLSVLAVRDKKKLHSIDQSLSWRFLIDLLGANQRGQQSRSSWTQRTSLGSNQRLRRGSLDALLWKLDLFCQRMRDTNRKREPIRLENIRK